MKLNFIELDPIPNQELSVTLDGARWTLRIQEAAGSMCADILRDDIPIIQGARIAAGEPIIAYPYLRAGLGDFYFFQTTESLPYYEQFGVTQYLAYLTADEIAAL